MACFYFFWLFCQPTDNSGYQDSQGRESKNKDDDISRCRGSPFDIAISSSSLNSGRTLGSQSPATPDFEVDSPLRRTHSVGTTDRGVHDKHGDEAQGVITEFTRSASSNDLSGFIELKDASTPLPKYVFPHEHALNSRVHAHAQTYPVTQSPMHRRTYACTVQQHY